MCASDLNLTLHKRHLRRVDSPRRLVAARSADTTTSLSARRTGMIRARERYVCARNPRHSLVAGLPLAGKRLHAAGTVLRAPTREIDRIRRRQRNAHAPALVSDGLTE